VPSGPMMFGFDSMAEARALSTFAAPCARAAAA
jgi:hypothetical protein